MRPIDADGFLDRNAEFANREFIHPKYQATLRELVDSEPTLSPDDVRGVGEWIKLGAHKGMEQYKCSVCETPTYVPECMNDPMYGYCPNCEARMSRAEAEKAMEVRG